MALQQIVDSRLHLHSEPTAFATATPLFTEGEYAVMPMEHCTEEQVAKLFAKACQRGNPVLQGRPHADLLLLGRAMYRKCQVGRTGTVAMHHDELVAIGCGWDAALGGVWAGSGLEMPASMAAHAACGKACMDSFEQRRRASTFFAAFYGVVVPHSVKLFGWLGCSHLYLAEKLGFEDTFQFTLIPTLLKRGVMSEKDAIPGADTLNYALNFDDVPSDKPEVQAELSELGGTINISLSSIGYALSPNHKKMMAGIIGMKADELCKPADLIATNQLKWVHSQSNGQITSRL